MEKIEQSYLEMSQLLSSYHISIQYPETDIKSSTKSRFLNHVPLTAFEFVSQAEINIKSREVERLKMLLALLSFQSIIKITLGQSFIYSTMKTVSTTVMTKKSTVKNTVI